MNDIKVNKNITVTIKGQTFVLSAEEAKDLLNKLKGAGVNDYSPTYPIIPWTGDNVPWPHKLTERSQYDPWPYLPPYDSGNATHPAPWPLDIWYSTTSDNKTPIYQSMVQTFKV